MHWIIIPNESYVFLFLITFNLMFSGGCEKYCQITVDLCLPPWSVPGIRHSEVIYLCLPQCQDLPSKNQSVPSLIWSSDKIRLVSVIQVRANVFQHFHKTEIYHLTSDSDKNRTHIANFQEKMVSKKTKSLTTSSPRG